MELSQYDQKHVRVKDIYGKTHTGVLDHCSASYCMHEYGEDEEGAIIGGYLVYASQIASIETIQVHGTAELRTERLILRRYRPQDAEDLYRYLGSDPDMARYSGWNPYASPELARKTVRSYIARYRNTHFYSWILDSDDVIAGTIGAYDYADGRIEVGFSIVKAWRGRGLATEALRAVLDYLAENEGIPCVTAWCAAENTASRRVMEKAGMRLVRVEKDGLRVEDRVYDRLVFEFRLPKGAVPAEEL